MNMSNHEGRTIPHGNVGDDELIDSLIGRLNALEEKEKKTVSISKRALYVIIGATMIVFSTTAALSISAHMRINEEDAGLSEARAGVSKNSFILNKLVASTEVTSDGAAESGLTEMELEEVDEEFKELERNATKADFSPAFWYGTSFKRQVWNPTYSLVCHIHTSKHTHNICAALSIIFMHIRFEG